MAHSFVTEFGEFTADTTSSATSTYIRSSAEQNIYLSLRYNPSNIAEIFWNTYSNPDDKSTYRGAVTARTLEEHPVQLHDLEIYNGANVLIIGNGLSNIPIIMEHAGASRIDIVDPFPF
jgi:hypothetical protein